MRYSRLGNSGLIVSRLAFGVMTFGQGKGAMASVSKTGEQDAEAMVQRSLEAGINFFDAADSYASGQSEVFLGKALGARRKDVIISTKVGFRSGEALIHAGASCAHLLAGTEASLRRLGTDYIDLLSIHKPDPFTPYEETARALDNLVQRGLVRYVGYSNLSAWQSAKFIGIQERYNYSRFIAAQMYYSLVGRDLEHEVVPFCEDAGVGIVVWSPLAGGFLTGRYSGQDSANGKGRLESFDFLPTDRKKSAALIEKMKIIANRHRGTVAQVALGWLLAKPYVTSILLGASRMSQLEDNLGALELGLSPEEIAELDQETAAPVPYPNWFQQRTLDVTMRDALQQGLPARPSEVKV
jgi:aryl-alcohol dehydrogenase-like predicted oxidoreductase